MKKIQDGEKHSVFRNKQIEDAELSSIHVRN